MKLLALLSSLLLSMLFMPAASAGVEETTRETDTHIIHFNVFNSSFLTPEIAKQYDLKRSKYYSMLNIAVRAARSAGNIIARGFEHRADLMTEVKGENDFVTRIDKLIIDMEQGAQKIFNLAWDLEKDGKVEIGRRDQRWPSEIAAGSTPEPTSSPEAPPAAE